jgi:hypothetical protein
LEGKERGQLKKLKALFDAFLEGKERGQLKKQSALWTHSMVAKELHLDPPLGNAPQPGLRGRGSRQIHGWEGGI